MKHFRLNFFLIIAGIIATAAATVYLLLEGLITFAILCVAALFCLITALWRFLRRITRTMQSFICGLEMNDNTMRFDMGKDDPELREMSDAMNRIAKIYKDSRMALETRKIYYDRILKIMTHEMRNAITPIEALTADMKKNPEKYSGETLSETISLINSQSNDIKHFLDSYHKLTHIPVPDKHLTDSVAFFDNVRATATAGLCNRNCHPDVFSFFIAPNSKLLIDCGLMMQVMHNLLKNAVEALTDTPNPHISVKATKSGDFSLITVEDNGPGLSPQIAQNLFQPFCSTKKDGSGIGLFISRQIVRLHGGDIQVRSLPGKGVCIQITIPLTA